MHVLLTRLYSIIPKNYPYRTYFKNTSLEQKLALIGSIISVPCLAAIFYYDNKFRAYWDKTFAQISPENISFFRNRTCVVLLISSRDHNSALNYVRSSLDTSSLDKTGALLVARKIESGREVRPLLAQLASQGNTIACLILAGHGNSKGIEMGKDHLFSAQLRALPMPHNAHLVLLSCSTAKETTQISSSFARQVSLNNPSIFVDAASEDIQANTLQTSISFDKKGARIIPSVSLVNSWGKNVASTFKNGFRQ